MDGGLRFRGFRFLAALGLSTLGVCSRVGMLPGDLERYLLQVQGLFGLEGPRDQHQTLGGGKGAIATTLLTRKP